MVILLQKNVPLTFWLCFALFGVSTQFHIPFPLVLWSLVWLRLLEKGFHTTIEEGDRKNWSNTIPL
jgi:hypothetical protein